MSAPEEGSPSRLRLILALLRAHRLVACPPRLYRLALSSRRAQRLVAVLAMLCAAPAAVACARSPSAASPTSAAGAARQASAPNAPIVYRVRTGAEVDLGWTGIAHDQPWPADQRLRFDLRCSRGNALCALGGGKKGSPFGAPIPLSSGGVPVCVLNRLRGSLTGTVNAESGCGEIRLRLTSMVFLAQNVAHPCPMCNGDAIPHDGRRDGRCDAGADRGVPCDVHGTSALFGATSDDCRPSGSSVGELQVDLLPMTTGTVRIEARTGCESLLPATAGKCFCSGQSRPNACDSGLCAAGEACDDGPTDGACSEARYRSCRPGTGQEECGTAFSGTGVCEKRARRCFGETIVATGACDPVKPTYVAVFCTPPTRAPALNMTAGLPGPARLFLPLERVP